MAVRFVEGVDAPHWPVVLGRQLGEREPVLGPAVEDREQAADAAAEDIVEVLASQHLTCSGLDLFVVCAFELNAFYLTISIAG